MFKQILLAIALFAIVLLGYVVYRFAKPALKPGQISIGAAVFNVEIADTVASRIQGLSGRDGLASNEGMLFLFPVSMTQGFWMKGMKFPLDIIWIGDNKVVGMVLDAEPEAGPEYTIYKSPEPVDKVLEINAGQAVRSGIRVGDALSQLSF